MNELIENLNDFLKSTNNLNVIIPKLKESSRKRLQTLDNQNSSENDYVPLVMEYWTIELLLNEFRKLFDEIKSLNLTNIIAQTYYEIGELEKIIDKYSRLIEFQSGEVKKAKNTEGKLPDSILYLFTDFEGKIEADIKTEALKQDFLTIAGENLDRWESQLKEAENKKRQLENELKENFKRVEKFKTELLDKLNENQSKLKENFSDIIDRIRKLSGSLNSIESLKILPREIGVEKAINLSDKDIHNLANKMMNRESV